MSKRTKESLRMKLHNHYTPGRWLMVPRSFLWALSPDEAILLAYLIGVADSVHAERRYAGWFFRGIERTTRELPGFNADKQQRVLRKLEDRQVIAREYRGSPPKRYIRVEYVELDMEIRAARKAYRKPPQE